MPRWQLSPAASWRLRRGVQPFLLSRELEPGRRSEVGGRLGRQSRHPPLHSRKAPGLPPLAPRLSCSRSEAPRPRPFAPKSLDHSPPPGGSESFWVLTLSSDPPHLPRSQCFCLVAPQPRSLRPPALQTLPLPGPPARAASVPRRGSLSSHALPVSGPACPSLQTPYQNAVRLSGGTDPKLRPPAERTAGRSPTFQGSRVRAGHRWVAATFLLHRLMGTLGSTRGGGRTGCSGI